MAKIEAADADVLARYAEFREAIGDLLSENGLQGVVDDFEASSKALQAPDGTAPQPAQTPAG